MPSPTINFPSIREHNGAKGRGFEELVVQLIPWIDEDVGTRDVVRHGAPDGGVEAHVEFDDGSIWGWQAKYFFQIGDSQLNQMKRSFQTALETSPYALAVHVRAPVQSPLRPTCARTKRDAETQCSVRSLGIRSGLYGQDLPHWGISAGRYPHG